MASIKGIRINCPSIQLFRDINADFHAIYSKIFVQSSTVFNSELIFFVWIGNIF